MAKLNRQGVGAGVRIVTQQGSEPRARHAVPCPADSRGQWTGLEGGTEESGRWTSWVSRARHAWTGTGDVKVFQEAMGEVLVKCPACPSM